MGNSFALVMIFNLILLSISCQQKPFSDSALNALSTFTLEPGFKIELVASEPMVADPVAMEIDERGRIYVVEMHGYPLDLSGTGKVKMLTDTDGDGQIDRSSTFVEGLLIPTGILRWKQGVIVVDPPSVLYFEDTDDDGVADKRDTLLTGFAVSNPQHNTNNPILGLDNWIYVAHESPVSTTVYKDLFGDHGSDIVSPSKPSLQRLPKNASGRSVRFNPDAGKAEIVSSKTQFGHTFDAWGHYLLVTNANHIQQEVIAAAYLQRNPDQVVPSSVASLSDHGHAAEVFPTTTNPELQMLTNVGVMTSACGITAYLGNAFSQEYNENIVFVAEPVSNLVHADKLTDKGATFMASRVRGKKEFLTSTDSWFRPVNMYVGPDGALYVVDYYRQIIEHPEWMSEEVNQSGALYNGKDQGRIYRITAEGTPKVSWTKELAEAQYTNDFLVEKLSDPNIWWRRNAQRMLVDRSDLQTVPMLIELSKNLDSAVGRLHALWTLEGIGQLSSSEIRRALNDPEPGIRENAIKLAERHLVKDPSMAEDLLALASDNHPKVKFQLLCALGFVQTPEADKIRQDLLFENLHDPWMQIAALSAPNSHKTGLLDAVLARFRNDEPAYASLVQRLSAMAGASQDVVTIQRLIARATSQSSTGGWQGPVLQGLAQGLRGKNTDGLPFASLRSMLITSVFNHTSAPVRKGSLDLLRVMGLPDGNETNVAIEKSRRIAANLRLDPRVRAEAVEFIGLANPVSLADFLKSLIATGEALPVQVAALRALSAIPDVTVSNFVIERWPTLTPDLRDVGLDTFFESPERVKLLLDAIESDAIPQGSVDFYRSVRLRTNADVTLRNRARAIFDKRDGGRKKVVDAYKTALTLSGDVTKGEGVFKRNCSTCHQVRGQLGVPYGPDLGTVHNWPPESILAHILDPNLSISDGYDAWEVTLSNGETIHGIISTETPNALTLRNAGGQETTIPRQDIVSLKTMGMSTMPTGLEAQIDHQSMADLLAFLRRVE